MSYLSKIMREQREAAREQTPEAHYERALEALRRGVERQVQEQLDILAYRPVESSAAGLSPLEALRRGVEPPAAVLSRPSIPACFRRIT